MPHYCIDADPEEYGDRRIHDLTPGWCHHLPRASHQESLGWHRDVRAAIGKARLRYRSATACIYCCAEQNEPLVAAGRSPTEKSAGSKEAPPQRQNRHR